MNKLEQFSSLFNNFRSRIIQNDRWNYTKGKMVHILVWIYFEQILSQKFRYLDRSFHQHKYQTFEWMLGGETVGIFTLMLCSFFILCSYRVDLVERNDWSSIYQYSNIVRRLSGQTIFGVVFLCPSLFWELRDKIFY